MSVWIRSQDKKKLILVEGILHIEYAGLFQKEHFTYKHYKIVYENFSLGEYEQESRVIEVLDEIQEHLDNGFTDTFVMPEE